MIIKCQRPKENLTGRLATDYYLDNEKVYGQNILRNLSLRKCLRGDVSSQTLMALDSNYAQTVSQVDMAMHGYLCDFIGLYADNDHLVAHTTITANVDKDGHFIAEVSEIHIANRDGFTSDGKGFNIVLGIYRQVITFIEECVSMMYPDIERIDLISLADDANFWDITSILGYDIESSGDLPGYKIRFSKMVRERNMTYERHITNRQE